MYEYRLNQTLLAIWLACQPGWLFFNGHCYKLTPISIGLHLARDICDFHDAYGLSINSPIESKFFHEVRKRNLQTGDMWIGLYKDRFVSPPSDPRYFEWEDGERITDTDYGLGWQHWEVNGPDTGNQFVAVAVHTSTCGDNESCFNDKDTGQGNAFNGILCEKPATVPTIGCTASKRKKIHF